MTFEKEITVETKINFDELDKILKENGFHIKKELTVYDKYLVQKNNISLEDYLGTLSKCVIIRTVKDVDEEKKYIMYKYKQYNKKEEIVKQGSVKCDIVSVEKAEELFNLLDYSKLIELEDHITVYMNDRTELNVKQVNGKHIYIEMEMTCNYLDKKYLNVDHMIQELESYNIPYDRSNYYVKKAEVELKETLNIN